MNIFLGVLLGLVACFHSVVGMSLSDSASIWMYHIKSSPSDIQAILTYPYSHKKETLTFTAVELALISTDKATTSWLQETVSPKFQSDYPDLGLPHVAIADEYLIVAVTGLYINGVFRGDSKIQHTALLAGKATTYSYFYSHVFLKGMFGRSRPYSDLNNPSGSTLYTEDPWDFGHSHNFQLASTSEGSAFPSFHFTLFFSVGKVFEDMYDNKWLGWGIPALGLLPNFQGHAHWTSDMVAGALIGRMIGKTVVDTYRRGSPPEMSHATHQWAPIFYADTVGMYYTYTF